MKSITQPLNRRAGDEHTSFQCIFNFTVESPGDGRYQSALRLAYFGTGVHKHETTRAICILGEARFETTLSEQCSLLVPRNTTHGYRDAVVRPGSEIECRWLNVG